METGPEWDKHWRPERRLGRQLTARKDWCASEELAQLLRALMIGANYDMKSIDADVIVFRGDYTTTNYENESYAKRSPRPHLFILLKRYKI